MLRSQQFALFYLADGTRHTVPNTASIRREYINGDSVFVCKDAHQQVVSLVNARDVIGYYIRRCDQTDGSVGN
jgi:hypothetical protein